MGGVGWGGAGGVGWGGGAGWGAEHCEQHSSSRRREAARTSTPPLRRADAPRHAPHGVLHRAPCDALRVAPTYDAPRPRQARAEHLKKQRDLLLAQRKKAREADLANYTPPPPPAAPPAPTAAEIAAAPPPGSMRGKVGAAPRPRHAMHRCAQTKTCDACCDT